MDSHAQTLKSRGWPHSDVARAAFGDTDEGRIKARVTWPPRHRGDTTFDITTGAIMYKNALVNGRPLDKE